jgi:hypothetical protein
MERPRSPGPGQQAARRRFSSGDRVGDQRRLQVIDGRAQLAAALAALGRQRAQVGVLGSIRQGPLHSS